MSTAILETSIALELPIECGTIDAFLEKIEPTSVSSLTIALFRMHILSRRIRNDIVFNLVDESAHRSICDRNFRSTLDIAITLIREQLTILARTKCTNTSNA